MADEPDYGRAAEMDVTGMKLSRRAIAIPSRQVRRKLGNPKLPTGAQSVQAWDQYHSQLADIDMERLRATGIPGQQDQFVKRAAKQFRNTKRQAYKV
jgi:hypothetical protein